MQARQLADIGFAPQPTHIGVAPHDARGRAGRVQQNRIKLLTCCCGVFSKQQGIHHFHFCGIQLQALQILVDALGAFGVQFHRGQLQLVPVLRREFKQMRGFAAGRRAGIEHAQGLIICPALQQQRCSQLCRRVLHRKMPGFIAR